MGILVVWKLWKRRKKKSSVAWRHLQQLKTWQLVVLLILASFIAATFLRLNNIGMIQRREAVMTADKQTDNQVTTDRLLDLQQYSTKHMNANTGTFFLENQYHRDAEAAKQAAIAADDASENIYKKVDDEICGPQAKANNWRWPDVRYTNCLAEQLAKYPGGSIDKLTVSEPDPKAFSHSFASPLWSPDFAGFSVLVVLLIAFTLLVRLLLLLGLTIVLKVRQKLR